MTKKIFYRGLRLFLDRGPKVFRPGFGRVRLLRLRRSKGPPRQRKGGDDSSCPTSRGQGNWSTTSYSGTVGPEPIERSRLT